MTLIKLFSPRLAKWLTVSLAAVLLATLAGLCWQLVGMFREIRLPIAGEVDAPSSNTSAQQYNVQSLLAVPLFGLRPSTPVAGAEIQKDIRRSALKITVIGLVAGNDERGVAVLRHGSKTKAYGIGEKIDVPGTVTLLAVLADHIIIENNRKQEKIELDQKAAAAGLRTAGAPRASYAENVDLTTPGIRELVGDPRDTVQNSPLQLVRFFSVNPVMDGGKVTGYAVKPGRDGRLFSQLSLEPGDVVLSVNGQSLSDMSPPELMKMMENTSSYELLIKRADTILTKRFDL
ncbi:type II secretion system protein GspC [Zhongshania guokunii]|uniref:Type II secretion system protein GspC n=1 Tax=Zhongshania guokunii TaxID=641783 RepID=A0ABV3U173_9GAMM